MNTTVMGGVEGIHRRKNILTGDWVLVSPHRNNRPWKGAVERTSPQHLPVYREDCPLCSGNPRANGEVNPDYTSTFAFTNDFSALAGGKLESQFDARDPLFITQAASGECRVLIYSPDHNKSLPQMTVTAIEAVVKIWIAEFNRLKTRFNWIQIFENKGEIMGCSQPHPHGQIWAHNFVPSLLVREGESQAEYHRKHQSSLLLDYAMRESEDGARTVAENCHWVAVVPYWAAWPFEILLLPKFPAARIDELDGPSQHSLARVLQEITSRYDNIFECSFPYSMGWHGAPLDAVNTEYWQLHAHFLPPLLRSATVKKHMVGYEMLAESQRDITPEKAAAILRSVAATHYSWQT